MIYDIIENISQYTGLFANLDTALQYIEATDLSALPLGKTVIDGDNVYVNVVETLPVKSEEADFETHTEYMDIHIDLEGCEIIEFAMGDVVEAAAYNPEKDFALYKSDLSCACVMGPGRFAICMTEEPHKPLVAAKGSEHLLKCVFKVKRD